MEAHIQMAGKDNRDAGDASRGDGRRVASGGGDSERRVDVTAWRDQACGAGEQAGSDHYRQSWAAGFAGGVCLFGAGGSGGRRKAAVAAAAKAAERACPLMTAGMPAASRAGWNVGRRRLSPQRDRLRQFASPVQVAGPCR